MPLREYQCLECGHIREDLVMTQHDIPSECNHCESKRIELLPSIVGGYTINGSNSASTRPKSAGSFKRTK